MLKNFKKKCLFTQSLFVITALLLNLSFGAGISNVLGGDSLKESDNTFLWEIRKDGKKLGALFGTFHMGKKENIVPPKAQEYLDQSNQIVMENVIIFKTLEEEQAMMMAALAAFPPTTQTIAARYAAKYVKPLRDYLESKGMPRIMHDTISDELIFVMLAMDMGEGYSPDYGMEELIKKYVMQNKALTEFENIGLEEISESLQLLKDALADTVRFENINFLEHREMLQDYSQKMASYYVANDAINLLKITKEMDNAIPMTEDERKKNEAMLKKLNTDRNYNWLPKLSSLLNNKGGNQYFIAVGALHLFGAEGVIELLRKEGFELVPVVY